MTQPQSPSEQEIRAQIVGILGVETDPNGIPEQYLIRNERGQVINGIDFKPEIDQLEALIAQAADKREQELVGWLDAAIHTRLTRIEVDNGLKMPLLLKARKQFSTFIESEINAHIASQSKAAEGEGE